MVKKPKCIHLITGLNSGGAEMMLYKTVKNLSNKYDPIVVSLTPPDKISDLIAKENIPVYHLNLTKNPFEFISSFFTFLKVLKREKPALIHSYMFHADMFGRIGGTLMRVPVIISSIRNENIGGSSREKIFKWTDFMVDQTTAICHSAGKAQVANRSVKSNKLKVIYNGIELDKFSSKRGEIPKIVDELNLPRDKKVVVTVGRLTLQKNHDLLLRSFAEVHESGQEVVLLIVGDGELRDELQTLSEKLSIDNLVYFTGVRSDINEILALSDFFVLASSWEGMPNVILEAMAAYKPVIATNVGGTPEIIENKVNGFLVEPNNKESLTSQLDKVISMTESERTNLGKKARKTIEENFSIDTTVQETEKLYERLLKREGIY